MLHELHAALAELRAGSLAPVCKMLARVARIMEQLVHAWDVLGTMTPTEYSAIRPSLGQSSGFQSSQYREIEFILGNKNATLLQVHASVPHVYARLASILNAPSLYDEVVRHLARTGFAIDGRRLGGELAAPTRPDASVEAAWLQV